jgi:RNA polymerase sigma-70 factor, ECF subfamily
MDKIELDGLFASCMPKLARAARHIMRNTQDSEDVLQDGLLSAFQKLHQFQGRSKFSTWLHSIIINTAKMHLRKGGAYQLISIDQESPDHGGTLLENTSDPKPNAEETCAEHERSLILRGMLKELSPAYRSVIQLCDIEGMNGKDAAAVLGISISSLKTSLHRARRQISKKIQQSFQQDDHSSRAATRTAAAPSPAHVYGLGEKREQEQDAPLPLEARLHARRRARNVIAGVRQKTCKRNRQAYRLTGAAAHRGAALCSLPHSALPHSASVSAGR